MNQIKKYRERSDLTQEDLSKLLQVSQSAVAMWETQKTMPVADKLPELANIFNCSIDELFSEQRGRENGTRTKNNPPTERAERTARTAGEYKRR